MGMFGIAVLLHEEKRLDLMSAAIAGTSNEVHNDSGKSRQLRNVPWDKFPETWRKQASRWPRYSIKEALSQITTTTLSSAEGVVATDLAINAASMALCRSRLPLTSPVAATRIAEEKPDGAKILLAASSSGVVMLQTQVEFTQRSVSSCMSDVSEYWFYTCW